MYSENKIELWSDAKEAVAVCEIGKKNLCYVVINGKRIDVTHVVYANIGKLGTRKAEEYEKVVTFPSKWVTASDPEYLVQITTQAWLNGQRYTVIEPVYIKNGVYLQR